MIWLYEFKTDITNILVPNASLFFIKERYTNTIYFSSKKKFFITAN